MKKLVKLIVLFVVLAGLIAGYVFYSSYMAEQEDEGGDVEQDTSVEVLSIDADAISSIEYVYDEETVSLKKEGGTWQWTEDAEFPVDQSYPEYMVEALSKIVADRLITETLENEADFGMDEPNFTIRYSTTGGQEYVYTIGDYNSTAKGYYIKSSAHEKIYMTKDSAVEPFVYYMLDMISPETVAEPKAEDITTVELVLDGKTHILTTDSKGADFYTDPYTYFYVGADGKKIAADGLAAAELMSAVAESGLGYVSAYKKDAETLEKYGLGEKKLLLMKVTYNEEVKADESSDATVSVTTSKDYSLYVGRFVNEEGETEYYAMTGNSDILYEFDGGEGLFKALEADFSSKLVCPVLADDTVSFKVEIGGSVYFYNIVDIENNEKLTGIFNSITSIVNIGKTEEKKGDLLMKVTFDMGDGDKVLEIYKYNEESYIASFDVWDGLLVSAEKIDKIIKDLQS